MFFYDKVNIEMMRREYDEESNKYVKQVKKALKRKGVDFAHAGTGDTIVIGVKYDDGFNDIYVAKNYYNFCYPREKEKE